MIKIIDELNRITDNLYKQGKTDQEVKTAIKLYLRKQKEKYITVTGT